MRRVRTRLHAALDRERLHRIAAAFPPARAVARRLATAADGTPVLASGPVHWEGLDFAFTAPFKTHRRAVARGIENIISRCIRIGVPAGGTVVDVGANYGFITLVAARTVGPEGTVISLEPDPQIVPVLAGNLADNGVTDVVQLVDRAAGPPGGSGATVDTVVGTLGPVDLVKVDTDGDDYGVLRGCAELIARDHPVVVVEISRDEAEIVAWLRERYAVVIGQDGEDVDGPPWPENVLALPDRPVWLSRAWHREDDDVDIPAHG